ncbi:hypothetical protein [Gemmiger formicilis]|uniref:hypothetical protein n=1 Tax=Gemmiger formicilis TaxID=745368 RepID=UPI00399B28C1
MPCFGTTEAHHAPTPRCCAEAAGRDARRPIDITRGGRAATLRTSASPQTSYDVTFENCQARERTLVLMDYANKNGGFVIGTGDLSELALGWATYNGDHMSMYGVNCSASRKRWCAIWCTTWPTRVRR